MPPSGEPVAWQVLEWIKTQLESVAAGSDYYHTIERVEIADASIGNLNVYPAAIVHPGRVLNERQEEQLVAARQSTLQTTIEAILRTNEDQSLEVARIARDIDRALRVDDQAGELVTLVEVTDWDFVANDEADLCGALMQIEVSYRTEIDDLNTAV